MVERTWRLLALARMGQVSLDLDVSTGDEAPTYMLTLGLPGLELRFEIAGRDTTQALSAFMRENHDRKVSAELQIGLLDGLPVRIIKDDEHADRFFISAAREGMIDVTIVNPVATDLVRATEELAAGAATR
jgi:hypothetical protein